jgi:hypothetical protein
MKSAGITGLFILIAGVAAWFGYANWLGTALAGALAGIWLQQTPKMGWSAGFASGFSVWWGAAFLSNMLNNGLLAAKVGAIFKGLQGWQLLTLTGLIGGLLAGLGVLVGIYGRALVRRKAVA